MIGIKTFVILPLVAGVGIMIMWKMGHKLLPSPQLPTLPDRWWGKENKGTVVENETIRRFKISVPEEVLDDLKQRLNNTRFSEPLGDTFQYGFNSKYLREIITYWQNQYDWRKEEKRLNQFEGYKTKIDGIDVHFLHVKPKVVPVDKKVIPLLMIHGWPGSVVEFYKILPLLTTTRADKNFVFEVICPHIPGYGFSEAPHRPGFSPLAAAQLFNKLMARLGFSSYYAQGGDWGSLVTTYLGMFYPERLTGIHLTMFPSMDTAGIFFKWTIGNWLPWLVVDDKDYTKLYPMGEKFMFLLQESGYLHLQATKPETVGSALGDSPAGLTAYILEKFSTWTAPENVAKNDGGLTKKFSVDELLTNVMIYWVTGSITSSMRFYKESFTDRAMMVDKLTVNVPTGFAVFPNEIMTFPRSLAEHRYFDIVHFNDMPRGGHFAAWEEPNLLAPDIWEFVNTVEQKPHDSPTK